MHRHLFYLVMIGLLLAACSDTPAATPTPDPVNFNAAVETAIAATRTAEALTPTPTPVTPTPPPATPIASDTLPTITPLTSTPTSVEATPSPTAVPAQSSLCTVIANALNLRSGPGAVYEPPLGAIIAGTQLTPLAYSPSGYPEGRWLQVQVTATGQTGWVSANPQLVTCNIDLATLPPAVAPPTPTPVFTPTPAPIASVPTPTPPQRVRIPPDGGKSNLQGFIVLPGYSPGQVSDPMIFRDRLVIQVEVYDPDFGNHDGAGINNVQFTIKRDDGDDTTLYQRQENTPGYCAFGGGEPNCNVLVFAQNNNRWPETNRPIVDGPHRVFAHINRQNGDTEIWNWGFEIIGALPQAPEPANISAQIAQTAPGTTSNVVSDALVFQVFASTDGANDGAGIDRVDLRIIKDGQEVHQRTEQNAAYCAFGGGEPNCNVWNFAEHGNTWPNGDPIESGPHSLRATVYAENGQTTMVEFPVEIQLSSN